MTTEQLQWLQSSSPPAPAGEKPAEPGALACPTCGWPLVESGTRCAQCGYSPDGRPAVDLLAELEIELPPPEIEIEPRPAHWFRKDSFDSPEMYHLRLQAEQLRVTSGFDRLICLDDISVDHYQHQLEAALRALRDMRGRALLADEVGLGKTIEAGIVMKELIERGLVNRVLILTPASLTWQWHEEMETKFHEQFTVLERRKQLPPADSAPARCRWIVSLDRAKHPHWAKHLLARDYDLLIVDEAHKLKNHRTQAHRFVNQIRKRYVLMLTATPVHNNLMELYNLITILRPGHLGTRQAFRQNFVAPAQPASSPKQRLAPRRTVYSNFGATPHDYLGKSYERRLAYRRDEAKGRWILKRTEAVADLDRLEYLDRGGEKAIREVKQLLAQDYEVFDFEAVEYLRPGFLTKPRRTDFVCRLKLKPQSDRPRRSRSERRTSPRNPAALRTLLREVMIRNRRSRVAVRFPPRKAAILSLELSPPERRLYENVTAYIREQLQHQEPGQKSSGFLRMTLMTLQKELCSSPQAVARTLKKMVDRRSDPYLVEQLVLAWGIIRGRKVEATLSILEQHPGKFLIFTDYLPTLHALGDALQAAGYETVLFHGGMSALERVEAVRTFQHSARVMISTRSGGEGHNLQFCHQMINFDLPWNPMRIEQRVGRLHRLGQKQPVTIFNLAAANTIEAYVLDLLAHKIRMFELVIGELDLILGEIGDERSFERYIEAAWAGSRSEAELAQMVAELEKILDQAQDTYREIRSASDELSDLIDAFDEVVC